MLLDFIRQINDDDGYVPCENKQVNECFSVFLKKNTFDLLVQRPMEEQRERYGPHLYNLTKMVTAIRVSLTLLWERYDTFKL